MSIIKDPEGVETRILGELADFTDCQVLEIGCGDGRLTWRYADKAAHVTAIDPIKEDIEAAQADLPARLGERVSFIESSIEDFTKYFQESRFDIAIFAWSL